MIATLSKPNVVGDANVNAILRIMLVIVSPVLFHCLTKISEGEGDVK